jgi:EmrB/QacA subfamily drug resistance transporter
VSDDSSESLNTSTSRRPQSPGAALSRARRIGVLAICCMALFITQIDNTIVNVALPSIGRQFGASLSGLQWTVDAYTLVLASLLMLSGSTADQLGRRRLFRIGLVVFTLGSLACSLAPSLAWLVAFRMLQAVGGSMLAPVAMSIIRTTFENPRERAQAIGLWGAVTGVALALGPVLGGLLVQGVGWRSIFWVNIPVGVAAVALVSAFVPESRAPAGRRADPVGQVLVVAVLASLTYAIIEGPSRGWGSAEIGGLFGVALVALAVLVGYELRRRQPLVEMRFFKSAPFSGATVIAVVSFIAFGGFLFLNTLYLQDVRGLSALHAGLDTLPMAGAIAVLSSISGRVVGRFGTRPSLALAGIAMAAGSLLLTGLSPATSFARLFLAYVVFGVGYGVVNAPITSTSRQIGQTLGVGIVGSAAVAGLAGGRVTRSFADATHAGWWILSVCGALVLVLGLLTTTNWARRTAERTALRFDLDDDPLRPSRVIERE